MSKQSLVNHLLLLNRALLVNVFESERTEYRFKTQRKLYGQLQDLYNQVMNEQLSSHLAEHAALDQNDLLLTPVAPSSGVQMIELRPLSERIVNLRLKMNQNTDVNSPGASNGNANISVVESMMESYMETKDDEELLVDSDKPAGDQEDRVARIPVRASQRVKKMLVVSSTTIPVQAFPKRTRSSTARPVPGVLKPTLNLPRMKKTSRMTVKRVALSQGPSLMLPSPSKSMETKILPKTVICARPTPNLQVAITPTAKASPSPESSRAMSMPQARIVPPLQSSSLLNSSSANRKMQVIMVDCKPAAVFSNGRPMLAMIDASTGNIVCAPTNMTQDMHFVTMADLPRLVAQFKQSKLASAQHAELVNNQITTALPSTSTKASPASAPASRQSSDSPNRPTIVVPTLVKSEIVKSNGRIDKIYETLNGQKLISCFRKDGLILGFRCPIDKCNHISAKGDLVYDHMHSAHGRYVSPTQRVYLNRKGQLMMLAHNAQVKMERDEEEEVTATIPVKHVTRLQVKLR